MIVRNTRKNIFDLWEVTCLLHMFVGLRYNWRSSMYSVLLSCFLGYACWISAQSPQCSMETSNERTGKQLQKHGKDGKLNVPGINLSHDSWILWCGISEVHCMQQIDLLKTSTRQYEECSSAWQRNDTKLFIRIENLYTKQISTYTKND